MIAMAFWLAPPGFVMLTIESPAPENSAGAGPGTVVGCGTVGTAVGAAVGAAASTAGVVAVGTTTTPATGAFVAAATGAGGALTTLKFPGGFETSEALTQLPSLS